jgi:hypothetical protein
MYEGGWKIGRWSGWGVLSDATDRVVYEGEFVDGQPHGLGMYHFLNGDYYCGEMREGELHGRGECVCVCAARRAARRGVGRCCAAAVRSVAHTSAPLRFRCLMSWRSRRYRQADSSRYEGGWSKNQRHGRGTYWNADGTCYEGEFFYVPLHFTRILLTIWLAPPNIFDNNIR